MHGTLIYGPIEPSATATRKITPCNEDVDFFVLLIAITTILIISPCPCRPLIITRTLVITRISYIITVFFTVILSTMYLGWFDIFSPHHRHLPRKRILIWLRNVVTRIRLCFRGRLLHLEHDWHLNVLAKVGVASQVRHKGVQVDLRRGLKL